MKYFFSALILISLFFYGCNDDLNEVGVTLLPDSDLIYTGEAVIYTDAFTFAPESVLEIDGSSLPLGNIEDSKFGKTSAGFMVELSPFYYNEIETGFVTDSVRLSVGYQTSVGDSFYFPQLQVYSLTEMLDKTTKYYTDFDKTGKYNPVNLVTSTISKPDTFSSSLITLRVKLDKSIGNEILAMPELNDTNLFINEKIDSIFDTKFSGLYINHHPTTTKNGFVYIYDVTMSIYYRNPSDTTTSSITLSFIPGYYPLTDIINNKSRARIIQNDKYIKVFEHDYTNSLIKNPNDTTQLDTAVYIQSFGGAQAILKMKGLESLRSALGDTQIIVNRAELILPFNHDTLDIKYYPTFLGIRPVSGYDSIPEDIVYSATNNSVGGRIDLDKYSYNFYLTKYFQDYFDGKVNNSEFKIFPGYLNNVLRTEFNTSRYNRMIINNNSTFNRRIALKIVYTKL